MSNKLYEQIELDLHRQFAENQNSHQKVFIELVVAFISLFAALGYVYSHLEQNVVAATDNTILFKPIVMYVAISVASILLCLIAMVVIDFGWSFRRDMKLNREIRAHAYEKDSEQRFERLFHNYGQNTDEMPDFYKIFLGTIFIIQLCMLIFNFTFRCCCNEFYCCDISPCYPIINFIIIIIEWLTQSTYYIHRQEKLGRQIKG